MLKFFKYNNRWYADVPNHTLDENEMVAGADQLLSELCTKCGFNDSISLDIDVAPKQPLITLKMIEHDSCGATYSVTSHMKIELDTKIVWICNVTHDVLGEHPEIIYINRMTGNSSNLNTTMEPKKTKKRNGVLGKGLMVLLIACVLQIPILLVKGLIEDRKELSNNVQTELTSSWGGLLDVSVPELCVPFYVNSTDKDGKATKEFKVRKIKSSATAVNVHADVEVLHRSIYEVPVYKADFRMASTFKTNESVMENINGKIYVTLPINTYKGLEGYPVLTIDGKEYTFSLCSTADTYITGTTEVKHTASTIVKAEQLYITGLSNNQLTAQWKSPADASVDSWTVRCYNETGYDETLITSEDSITFQSVD
jgi:hypothetical protein